MRRVSQDEIFTTVTVGTVDEQNQSTNEACQPGQYVACVYDQKWYVGNVKERSDEHFDVLCGS